MGASIGVKLNYVVVQLKVRLFTHIPNLKFLNESSCM